MIDLDSSGDLGWVRIGMGGFWPGLVSGIMIGLRDGVGVDLALVGDDDQIFVSIVYSILILL